MSNFVIAVGHTASENVGCGVVARLDESCCTREIGALVADYLKRRGHVVNLLRIDRSNSYLFEDCHVRAKEANDINKNSRVDLYVEIHINAGRGSGTEVCVIGRSAIANQYAVKVSGALSSALNLPNRGVKTRNLIVLKETIMPAILVECLFADSSDADKYDADLIARAIVNGLVGIGDSSNDEWKLGWNRNNVGWWYCTDIVNKYYYTSQNGWKEIDGEGYIFDDNDYALQNAWYHDESDGHWYYLDDSCKMVRGSKGKPFWLWIDGGCYAFNEHGQMYSKCITPDGFRVNESGAWIK